MAVGTVAGKLLGSHLVSGELRAGAEISLRIDQTLTQDATGTLVMLELEALGLDKVRTEVSAQYVDHNLLQEDFKNADDHLFLQSACRRFGVWFSRAGNGVSHPVHMEAFGVPGKTLLGSDSHTCAAGAIGMLAIGAGGLEVAMAMAGEPYHLPMPEIWGVTLTGKLPAWVSAKDVILELLRRHGVGGGRGRIIEYGGPGLAELDAWDRHVIANMGAELGATTSVFPSDDRVRAFLASVGREHDWTSLQADEGARYDVEDEIDLSQLVPLVARPSSPGNVVTVAEVAGTPIYQSYIGSSANPGYRDAAVVAEIIKDRVVAPGVSLDINPATRGLLEDLSKEGYLADLLAAGARLHQAGCNGCIGMGQAPATGRNSLRTVPRNFPGRSGTKEDSVWLCSPETAAASALEGRITDPRTLGEQRPVRRPAHPTRHPELLVSPTAPASHLPLLDEGLPPGVSVDDGLVKGPNIGSMPALTPLPDTLVVPVLLKMGDDVSTDEILPAGSRVLPFRSNIERISDFSFERIDPTYAARAREVAGHQHAVVGGDNYGQGSSREHAVLAPRWLGLRVVIAKSFARIHHQNLVNFGVLPLVFDDASDWDLVQQGDELVLSDIHEGLGRGWLRVQVGQRTIEVRHQLSERQLKVLLAGGLIALVRARHERLESASQPGEEASP